MTEKPNANPTKTSTWTLRALAGGAISAGFAFWDFAYGSSLRSEVFLSAASAAMAYAALWIFCWSGFLAVAAASLLFLESDEGDSGATLTLAFSCAILLVGLSYQAIRWGTSIVPAAVLLLGAALAPLLYQQLVKRFPRAAARLLDPVPLIAAIALFLAAAAYYWSLNYSSYALSGSGSLRWIGFAVLLTCAAAPILRSARSGLAWIWSVCLAGLAIFVFGSAPEFGPAVRLIGASAQGSPQVLVLTIDTLRADALSCYRPGAGPTPNIDRLAGDGTLFRQAYSPASWTIPSMTSLFTGVTPLVHGVSLRVQDAALPTIADQFLDAGYDTIGVFGNPVLRKQATVLNPDLAAHFDFYHGFRNLTLLSDRRFGETISGRLFAKLTRADTTRGANTEGIADLSLERLREHQGGPLFLWAHFYDPHWPYAPLPEFLPPTPPAASIDSVFDLGQEVRIGTRSLNHDERAWTRALYEAEVRYVDQAVGRILDYLRKTGAYDDSIIVLTSDHGEEFWEHGRYGHGHSLHRETVTVPLIIKLPGEPHGQVVDTPVENRALLPTLLELARIPHEPNALWASSLVPLLRQTGDYDASAPIVNSGVELFENEAAIRIGDLRYIRMLYSGDEKLYDLAKDPGETDSILTARPDDADKLRKALDDAIEASLAARKSMGLSSDTKSAFDEETLKRLKSLGYL